MYYDPMISKLITWANTRKEALDLLAKAMEEYVIRGVTHNVGFGASILRNKAFADGQYTTAFIPTYYPTGFKGDPLDDADFTHVALGAHYLKNLYNNNGTSEKKPVGTYFVTVQDHDFKIEPKPAGGYTVTNMTTNKATDVNAKDFDLQYGALLRYSQDGNGKLLQFLEAQDNLYFNFYYKGNTIKSVVYDEEQFKLKKYMAPPKVIDHGKSVISPMPGSIISVSVEPGQQVTEGQELLIVEAMKMQNIIKSEVDAKVKKINVKPGQSVAVDELLIEFA
jgi:propionyl-CoA carboxylase alpha chain